MPTGTRRPPIETSVASNVFPLGGCERGDQIPVGGRDELHAGPFAFHDQPHGDALNAARRKPRPDFSPEQRGNFISIKPVENPAGLLSTHQLAVNLPRVSQRIANRGLGDFVENQAVHGHLGFEDFAQVPADRFPLAVFVGREIEVLGRLQCLPQLGDMGFFVRGNDIQRLEVLLDVHAQPRPWLRLVLGRHLLRPLRQVPDVANAGFHHKIPPEKLADGPGLGRRLDNHERFAPAAGGRF